MKKNYFLSVALIILPLLFIAMPAQKAQAQDVAVSYQTFYDELAPYGQWVNDGQTNVWVPNVPPGFRPYATDGHWAMTDQGNMWMSDVPWSWACYHYGRWTYSGYYGWVWIPGYEWAPAWVNWRSGGGFYGWAPMGPGQAFGGVYTYPDNYWVFVNPTYLYHPSIYTYYERREPGFYLHQTEYINYGGHDHYYYGPRREVIERELHHPVEVYRVSSAREAGAGHIGGHELSIYRPAINRESERTAHPASVIDKKDHPIGKAVAMSDNHGSSQPAFRQEQVQQQHQQVQQRSQQQSQQRPQQQQTQQRPQQQSQQRPQQQTQQRPQPSQQAQQRPQQQQQRPQPQQQQTQQRPQQQVQQQPKQQPKPQEKKK